MTPTLLLAVAAGGAVGAVARYLAVLGVTHLMGPGFPWGTFAVNVLGSFTMGLVVELTAHVWSPSPALRTAITVGLLGAFTTFSTFSLDVVMLLQRGAVLPASLYVIGSVAVCVLGLLAGIATVRMVAG